MAYHSEVNDSHQLSLCELTEKLISCRIESDIWADQEKWMWDLILLSFVSGPMDRRSSFFIFVEIHIPMRSKILPAVGSTHVCPGSSQIDQ